MPASDIVHSSFVPERPLSAEELDYLSVDGSKAAFKQVLETGNWSGTSYATIAVHLFADNSRINSVGLSLGGNIEGNFTGATRFWPGMPNTFKFKPSIDLSLFTFAPGNLHSDLLDVSDLHMQFRNNDKAVTLNDFKAAGGADMCVKLVCFPSNHEFLHINCLVYPTDASSLLEAHPAAESPHFPGLLCINKDVIFNPAASPSVKWGSSIYPLIVKGNPEADLANLDCYDLRTKISKFLRHAVKGQSCLTIASLQSKWAVITRDGDSALTPSLPETLWPHALPLMPAGASLLDTEASEENNSRKHNSLTLNPFCFSFFTVLPLGKKSAPTSTTNFSCIKCLKLRERNSPS